MSIQPPSEQVNSHEAVHEEVAHEDDSADLAEALPPLIFPSSEAISKISLSLDCRLLLSSISTYDVKTIGSSWFKQGSTKLFHDDPQWTGTNWLKPPAIITGGPHSINAALIGEINEGIILAFRGTLFPILNDPLKSPLDWWQNFITNSIGIDGFHKNILVHQGFWDALMTIWKEIRVELAKYSGKMLYITGHSKGAALAQLAAAQLVWGELDLLKQRSLTIGGVNLYAPPRVGNSIFAMKLESSLTNLIQRFEAQNDIVTALPPNQQELNALKATRPILITALQRRFSVVNSFDYQPVGKLIYIKEDGKSFVNSYGGVEKVKHTTELLNLALSLGLVKGLHSHAPFCSGIFFSRGIYMRGLCPAKDLCPAEPLIPTT